MFQDWRNDRAKINSDTKGTVWLIGRCLHQLLWLTPTQLAFPFTRLPEDRRDRFTEWYVFVALIASVLIYYFVPDLAGLSTYISASTLIVMLHIVFLQPPAMAKHDKPKRLPSQRDGSMTPRTANVISLARGA